MSPGGFKQQLIREYRKGEPCAAQWHKTCKGHAMGTQRQNLALACFPIEKVCPFIRFQTAIGVLQLFEGS